MLKPIYLLEGTLYRNQNKNESDLICIKEEFISEDPIIARRNAFQKYKSYIDVLLDSLGYKFISHQQASRVLRPFVSSGMKTYFRGIPELEIDSDFDKGLFLYFIPSPQDKKYTTEGNVIYLNKYCIHYIDNSQIDFSHQVQKSLNFECKYYSEHHFRTSNQIRNQQAIWE